MIVNYKGSAYRVSDGRVEVRIPMRVEHGDVRTSYWRRLKDGPTALRVRIKADSITRKQAAASRIDGYDRDDLGESPDY